jgi:hypothetical protein
MSPILWAIENGFPDAAMKLLQGEADLNKKYQAGGTALSSAGSRIQQFVCLKEGLIRSQQINAAGRPSFGQLKEGLRM